MQRVQDTNPDQFKCPDGCGAETWMEETADGWERRHAGWEMLKHVGEEVFSAKLEAVCASGVHADVGLTSTEILSKSVRELITFGFVRQDCVEAHRVGVGNPDGRLVELITQSDVLAFVAANPNCFPPELLSQTLDQLNCLALGQLRQGWTKPVSVPESALTIAGFQEMVREHVSGVAVVDREGRIVGDLSACLLYTSDAADEEDSVDLGGRRILKKKKKGQR
eukprot:TRINITY_DN17947_c0_g1_i2.p1 TRINITY_DN17947_c0_g1~~TRINITY_DN17947_c0_g1_i2.p1  ORF type:complete len:223 (-),score=67.89 TRINITY_DN17947_c0_g1_i2:80-748(-)